MRSLWGIGLFSATVLMFQVTLTRLFSVAQFYHFAFLVVSLALLGFGASGSLLAAWPRLRGASWRPVYALAFGPATVLAYFVLNRWSFDSYAIAWDRTQVWRLLANLVFLAIPFTFAGAAIGAFLSDERLSAGAVYGANMIGSALGAALTPLLLAEIGDARIILLCSGLAAGAALLLAPLVDRAHARAVVVMSALLLLASAAGLLFPPDALQIEPSPYKALAFYQRNPDATLEAPRTNAYSRLDIVHSDTIHSAPGLSMAYLSAPPPEIGLLIDGDNLLPVLQDAATPTAFAEAMPASIALALRDQPEMLVLGAGGGMDVWIARALGAASVVAVEPNSLVTDTLRHDLRAWSGLADDPRITLEHAEVRTYARNTGRRFDIVQLALTDAYRPVTSGAFTLTENYTYTVEGFQAYLDLLAEDGLLVVTRWLQTPPSEELRTLGLILAALDASGAGHPAEHILAFRTFQTVTFVIKASPLTQDEVELALAEAERLRADMVLAPDLPPEAINRYARLPEPVYHTTFAALLASEDRDAFYAAYDFDVRPPTDNRPFFFHFFKWRQTPAILENLGRTWQPFGGSGYFVLIALLIFTSAAALVFVLLPVGLRPRFRAALGASGAGRSARVMAYFGALGLAYLLIEVATIQQFVLLLGQPTLAIATVLGTLLLFSGIGSAVSDRLPWGAALMLLAALAIVWPWLIDLAGRALLPLPLAARWPLSVALLAPLGFLMGVPFARGITAIRHAPDLVPWAWAINGSASVISAVVAALLALSLGFGWVVGIGGALYGVAWLTRPRA